MVVLKKMKHVLALKYMLIYVVFYLISEVNNLRQATGNKSMNSHRKVHRLLSYCHS